MIAHSDIIKDWGSQLATHQHLISEAEYEWQMKGIHPHLKIAKSFNSQFDGKKLRDKRTKGGQYLERMHREFIASYVAQALSLQRQPRQLVFGQSLR